VDDGEELPPGDASAGAHRRGLARDERRVVGLAALTPVVLALSVLLPIGAMTGAGVGEVLAATVVYGGLLGLAAAFVAVDRLQARHCPRCAARAARGAGRCRGCGYDLVERPRYACSERHELRFDDDELCACGRRCTRLPTARGIGREVAFALKLGAWLLALLVGIGIALQVLDRTL
jgi:ribosomal protein L40E